MAPGKTADTCQTSVLEGTQLLGVKTAAPQEGFQKSGAHMGER